MCLERGADVDRSPPGGSTPLYTACERCSFEVARLCFEHGADINRAPRGVDWIWPRPAALKMADWLTRIREAGSWTRYLSEPRYALVVLRNIVARGRARREHGLFGKERVLDFLFPGDQHSPRLPDDIFSVIARYYWCGEP